MHQAQCSSIKEVICITEIQVVGPRIIYYWCASNSNISSGAVKPMHKLSESAGKGEKKILALRSAQPGRSPKPSIHIKYWKSLIIHLSLVGVNSRHLILISGLVYLY